MKQSEILEAATAELLWDGKGDVRPLTKLVHVCDAVRCWSLFKELSPADHNRAQDLLVFIMSKINGFLDWKFYAIGKGQVSSNASPARFQQLRCLWVQSLIEELQEKNL